MLKTLKKKTKEFDWFGHPVQLGFNNYGSTYNTLFGGVASIVLRLLLLGYVLMKTNNLVRKNDNDINMFAKATDFEQLGSVQMHKN